MATKKKIEKVENTNDKIPDYISMDGKPRFTIKGFMNSYLGDWTEWNKNNNKYQSAEDTYIGINTSVCDETIYIGRFKDCPDLLTREAVIGFSLVFTKPTKDCNQPEIIFTFEIMKNWNYHDCKINRYCSGCEKCVDDALGLEGPELG